MGKKQQPKKNAPAEREIGADGQRRTRLRPVQKNKYRNSSQDDDDWDENEESDASWLYYGEEEEDEEEEDTSGR